jgi:hypothetical protein
MSAAATFEFFERREHGIGGAFVLSAIVHLGLVAVLVLGVRWPVSAPDTVTVDLVDALPPPPPAPVVVAPKPTSRINPHKLAKAEARVADLEGKIEALRKELENPALYNDGGARAATLGKQDAELRVALETAELELLALYEASAA